MTITTEIHSNEVLSIHCKSCDTVNAVKKLKADSIVKCGKCKEVITLELGIKKDMFNNKLDKINSSLDKIKQIIEDPALIKLFDEYLDNDQNINHNTSLVRIQEKIETLQTNQKPLTLVVTGEFNAGKSYLINSLIGEKLLPVDSQPVTMAPCFFKYGEETEIIIEFDDGRPVKNISKEEFKEIKHANKENLPKEYEQIKCINFKYPYPKLTKLNIIDTPGFNTATQKGDDEKTMKVILENAEVILWVFNANMGCMVDSEKNILTKLIDRFKVKNGGNFIETGLSRLRELNIPIIGLVNQIDVHGKPNSDKVKKVIEQFKKDSKMDTIIPYSAKKIIESYSAKKIIESKSKDINKEIAQIFSEKWDSNNYFSINIETIVDDLGKKSLKVIENDEVIFEGNNEVICEENIYDYSEWTSLFDNLENNLENIKGKYKSSILNSMENEVELIKREIKEKLFKVGEKLIRYISSIDQAISKFREDKSIITKDYENNFKINYIYNLRNTFFHVTIYKDWFNEYKIINMKEEEYIVTNTETIIYNCLDFQKNFKDIETIDNVMKNLRKTFQKNKSLDNQIELLSVNLKQKNSNLIDYTIKLCVNFIANNSISIAKSIYDEDKSKKLPMSLDNRDMIEERMKLIYGKSHSNILFEWLKKARIDLCDDAIERLNVIRKQISCNYDTSKLLAEKEELLS